MYTEQKEEEQEAEGNGLWFLKSFQDGTERDKTWHEIKEAQRKRHGAKERARGLGRQKEQRPDALGAGHNQPGQHFTCVTSCWPQWEEGGTAWWPAGAREPVRLTQDVMHCTKQTHIDLHTQTPPCLCKRVIRVKCRVGVTQTGFWIHARGLTNPVMQESGLLARRGLQPHAAECGPWLKWHQ